MTGRRIISDYQTVGFGGLAFITHINLANTPMSYEQRWWSLDAEYWFTLAKIELDEKYKCDPGICLLVGGIRLLLDQANEDYKSQFEDHQSFCDLENRYKKLLSQILGKITELQGRTRLIENQKLEQEVFG
jgi:hypothetical protein